MLPSSSVSPGDLVIAQEFVRRLAEHYDPALFEVTLFGSHVCAGADMEENHFTYGSFR